LLLPVLGMALAPTSLPAQIVSPGRLAAVHTESDGLRRCTACHELGRAGVDRDRCLACHEPLARRIADGLGYHARLRESDCAACHPEHLGRDAPLIRLDTAAFRHVQTGFDLRGAHAALGCRACHAPEHVRASDVRARGSEGFLSRTFLGLVTRCDACHETKSPHGAQFGDRTCEDCHDEERWGGASRFDHAAAAFRLTGSHRDVACEGCHPVTGAGAAARRWAGVGHASCAACHSDPHGGAMGTACRDCHTTEAWHRVPRGSLEGRFDHDRTGFPLTGGHAGLACSACHRPESVAGIRIRFARGTESFTYPRPLAGSCGACHLDPHRGELDGRCEGCHRDAGWVPTTYGLERHRAAELPLEGAHAAVPCGACHRDDEAGALRFRLETACADCHSGDDPHDGGFGTRGCGDCHVATSFGIDRFDHETAGDAVCRDCHDADDPHAGQFVGVSCDRCHGVDSFRIPVFDHGRAGFPLEGAHADAPCAACHPAEPGPDGAPLVRYRPVGTACRDCHGGSP
jgi:hypothetical protein